jgi:hypothetical protein
MGSARASSNLVGVDFFFFFFFRFLFVFLLELKKSTMRGDRTRDQSIKSRTLYRTELARLQDFILGDWSSGMILA